MYPSKYTSVQNYSGVKWCSNLGALIYVSNGSKGLKLNITRHHLKNECTKIITRINPQLSFRGIKTTECFNTMHASQQAHSSPLQPQEEEEVSCQFQKFPISIVTRCVKLYLKGEGYHHKRRASLVRESMCCPFLSFRDSIFPRPLIGLLALLLFVCFSSFLVLMLPCDSSILTMYVCAYTYCESQRIPSP